MGTREANESELPIKRRKVVLMASKPGRQFGSGISLGEILLTAQAAPGVEAARTWSAALMWNVGTCRRDVKGEIQEGGPLKGESTDARHGGGSARSSDEVFVMGMERRG